MANLSPFIQTTDRVQVLDVSSFRPHGNCRCDIRSKPENVLTGQYEVTNLTAGSHAVLQASSSLQDTPSNASTTTQRVIQVNESRESSREVSIETEFSIQGSLDHLGVSVGGSSSASNSTTSSISGSQSVTLEPRQAIEVLRATVVTVTPVWGLLRKLPSGPTEPYAHFVGYVQVTDSYNVLGELFSLD
jgi:hypothetical protein